MGQIEVRALVASASADALQPVECEVETEGELDVVIARAEVAFVIGRHG